MTRATIIEKLRAWLLANDDRLKAHELTDDTMIVERGFLTSLHAMSLLVYIEELRGEPIDLDSLRPGAFRSLTTIYERFFPEM